MTHHPMVRWVTLAIGGGTHRATTLSTLCSIGRWPVRSDSDVYVKSLKEHHGKRQKSGSETIIIAAWASNRASGPALVPLVRLAWFGSYRLYCHYPSRPSCGFSPPFYPRRWDRHQGWKAHVPGEVRSRAVAIQTALGAGLRRVCDLIQGGSSLRQ
jgi:hypothetical protein